MLTALLDRLGLGRCEPLGKVLLRAGVISENQLEAALAAQRDTGERLGRSVGEQGYASEYDVLQAIANHYGVSATALSDDFGAMLEARALQQKLRDIR